VLKKFDAFVRPRLSAEEMLYTDLPGLKARENPDSTIPFSLLVTTARPEWSTYATTLWSSLN